MNDYESMINKIKEAIGTEKYIKNKQYFSYENDAIYYNKDNMHYELISKISKEVTSGINNIVN